jgi:hypothetical protein
MKVKPYIQVDAIDFGISRESVVSLLGNPVSEGRTRKGKVELEYANAFYRFNGDNQLIEISIDAPIVVFGSVSVPFVNLGSFLKEHDHERFEAVGFIVSPLYGVGFDPGYPSWVTAFLRESLPLWQSYAS